MDDFIQVLIWLFIIISFFSSFFRKKNKQPNQSSTPSQRQQTEEDFPRRTQSTATVDQEEYDILKEIESMFKKETPQSRSPGEMETKLEQIDRSVDETTPTVSEHESYETLKRDDDYVTYDRKPPEVRRPDSRKRVSDVADYSFEASRRKREEKTRERVKQAADSAASERAESFERFLESRDTNTFNQAQHIIRRLKQPSTLKEYIIISEILGKPVSRSGRFKTLRR